MYTLNATFLISPILLHNQIQNLSCESVNHNKNTPWWRHVTKSRIHSVVEAFHTLVHKQQLGCGIFACLKMPNGVWDLADTEKSGASTYQ